MTDALPPAPRLSDEERERLSAVLGEHFASGRLTMDELRRRLDLVWTADTTSDVAAALGDLPPIAPAARRGAGRRRYAEADSPEPGWLPTAERFRDPTSGRLMRVWVEASGGGRHYVPEES